MRRLSVEHSFHLGLCCSADSFTSQELRTVHIPWFHPNHTMTLYRLSVTLSIQLQFFSTAQKEFWLLFQLLWILTLFHTILDWSWKIASSRPDNLTKYFKKICLYHMECPFQFSETAVTSSQHHAILPFGPWTLHVTRHPVCNYQKLLERHDHLIQYWEKMKAGSMLLFALLAAHAKHCPPGWQQAALSCAKVHRPNDNVDLTWQPFLKLDRALHMIDGWTLSLGYRTLKGHLKQT